MSRFAPAILGHLGPRGALIALAAPAWVGTGVGTLDGWSRTPPGAPHLLIPEDPRGWLFWIIPGLLSLVMLVPRRCDLAHRVAVTVLAVGPIVRLTSYGWAWLMYLIPFVPEGWAGGYYPAAGWFGHVIVILAMIYAPDTWHYLSADRARRERKQREAA